MRTAALACALLALPAAAGAQALDGGVVGAVAATDADSASAAAASAAADASVANADAGVANADAGAAVAPAPLPEPPADARPEIKSEISPREGLMTGDVVTWSLEISARATDDVSVVSLDEARGDAAGDAFGQLDAPVILLDKERVSEEATGGRVRRAFAIRYLLLAPGEQRLPELAVRVLTKDGALGFVPLGSPSIEVGAVLGNEPNAEPKPATAPVSVMEDDPRPLYALAALAAMLVGALLFFLGTRWWKRRSLRPLPPPPPRAPWVVALERLDVLRLNRADKLEQGESVEWADGLSDAVREYLGARFGFDGLESTTDELIERLHGARLGKDLSVHEVAALLQETDLVKFAKASFEADASQELLKSAYRIVRSTTPREPAPSSEGGPT